MRDHFTEHKMPNGTSCFFRHTKANGEEDHSYWLGCEPRAKTKPEGEWKGRGQLTGVSTLVKPYDFQPDALMRWAAKTNGIGIAQLYERARRELEDGETTPHEVMATLSWLQNYETIWQELERDGLTYNDVKEQAAERGTNVHKHALHAMALGRPVPDFEQLTKAEQGYARGVAAFWLEHAPRTLEAEQVCLDLDLGIAGRYDLRCEMDGDIVLLDAKTSGFIGTAYHVQLAGYDHCARKSGIGASERLVILQVAEDGTFDLIDVHATAEDFKLACSVYRRAAMIQKAARADRKERGAVAA